MDAIASSLFQIICFPHEGRIVTVDQLDCPPVDPNVSTDSTVSKLDNTKAPVENLGVGMYSSLMGTFDIPPPMVHIMLFHPPRLLFEENSSELIIFQTLGPYLPLPPH